MDNELKTLQERLCLYAQKIDSGRTFVPVTSRNCIDVHVPTVQGVYWIETTMPVEEMKHAILGVTKKKRRVIGNPPREAKLISQIEENLYVAYSGTEENIQKRLKQHLFNEGSKGTVKLGCVVDQEPFSQYKWRVSFAVIDSYEIRYAVEAWWRHNIGWPPFCLR